MKTLLTSLQELKLKCHSGAIFDKNDVLIISINREHNNPLQPVLRDELIKLIFNLLEKEITS